jgi:REP element-mobilizing transposase RayT
MAILLEYGKTYHVYNRGNNKEIIFRTNDDYKHFMQLYTIYIKPIAKTYAWCLMNNHFHFCIKIKEEKEIGYLDKKNAHSQKHEIKWETTEISDLEVDVKKPKPISQWKFLFNAYSKYFNHKYSRTGSLFEKNYERRLIEYEDYLKELIIYINRNPVKHKVCKNPGDYIWSSYLEISKNNSVFCSLDLIWKLFDDEKNFKFVCKKEKNEAE